jgi:hypothetical protein
MVMVGPRLRFRGEQWYTLKKGDGDFAILVGEESVLVTDDPEHAIRERLKMRKALARVVCVSRSGRMYQAVPKYAGSLRIKDWLKPMHWRIIGRILRKISSSN